MGSELLESINEIRRRRGSTHGGRRRRRRSERPKGRRGKREAAKREFGGGRGIMAKLQKHAKGTTMV